MEQESIKTRGIKRRGNSSETGNKKENVEEETKEKKSRRMEEAENPRKDHVNSFLSITKELIGGMCKSLLKKIYHPQLQSSTSSSAETPIPSESSLLAEPSLSAEFTEPSLRLSLDNYSLLCVLGSGGFAKVILAQVTCSSQFVALKVVSKTFLKREADIESAMAEKRILQMSWKCPFLSSAYATFQNDDYLFYVLEFLSGGDLYHHIDINGRLDLARSRFYAAEIVCGIQFLHSNGIIHRDLKPENILMDHEGHVQIADFGVSKENVGKDIKIQEVVGTIRFMAPEILLEEEYSFAVDWWSFGVLLFNMLVGDTPFCKTNSRNELILSVIHDTPHYPKWLSTDSKQIVRELLVRNPSNRLGVKCNPRNHHFLKDIDWVALEAKQLEPPYKPHVESPGDCQNFADSLSQSFMYSLINENRSPFLKKHLQDFTCLCPQWQEP